MGVIVFADGAVHPDPDEKQLAEIAVATAATTRSILGFEPRIAMMSFSTKGQCTASHGGQSGQCHQAGERNGSHLGIDGELQADAALIAFHCQQQSP